MKCGKDILTKIIREVGFDVGEQMCEVGFDG